MCYKATWFTAWTLRGKNLLPYAYHNWVYIYRKFETLWEGMCTADKRLYNSNMSIKIEPPKLCSLVTSSSLPKAPQRKFQTVSRSWRILSFWWPSVSHLYCCLFPEWKFPCDFVICLQLYFNSVTLVKSLETLIQTTALTTKTQLCRQETEEDRGKKMSQIKDIQVFLFLLGWRPWTTEQK